MFSTKIKYIIFLLAGVLLAAGGGCATHNSALIQGRGLSIANSKPNPMEKSIQNNLIRSDYGEGDVAEFCEAGLQRLSARLDTEVENAYDFDAIYADFFDDLSSLTFMAYVHTDKVIRDEASACEEKYNKALVEIFTRRDLYNKISATVGTTPDEKRIISELKLIFEKNGMALSESDLKKFIKLKSKLAKLEAQFSKNLNEDKSVVLYTADELKGVSKEFLARLEKNKDSQYIATTKSTDFTQVMENVSSPGARKKMLQAYDNKAAKANTQLLQEAISLRQQIAKVMKYKNWADYQIDGRMAKNSQSALDLILDLKEKLKPRLASDLNILLKAKQEMEDKKAKGLEAWDLRYFVNQVKKRDYSLDDDVIREYFPKDTVMAGLFEVYSKLFGVRIEEVEDALVWTPEVKLYAVREKANNTIVSYFYTDFIPREGKYGHAAAFPLIAGHITSEDYYSQPVAAIVANFTPPANGKPSLLNHREVETLFHEFGHIMHQTLTKAPYAYLAGSSTAQDFVEAPSQMLENWVWDADILNRISGHYKTGKKLPKELIQKMIAARDFNQGYNYSRQIMLGLTDLSMHTSNQAVDVTKLYKKTHQDVLTFAALPDSHFVAGFGHMMGGYDAGYYGYLWSEVFAEDMFTVFHAKGLLNEDVGLKYRYTILTEGKMSDPEVLLTEFLGRKPNNEAFLKRLGL